MDFEEWLWANGIKSLHIDYLKKCLTDETPVEEALHDRFRNLLHQYVVVGGMPEAVSTFLDTKQIGKVLAVQRRIIEEYKSDMVQYAPATDKPRIRECFESIPAQLAREYKKATKVPSLKTLLPTYWEKWSVSCIISIRTVAWNLIFLCATRGSVYLWNAKSQQETPNHFELY